MSFRDGWRRFRAFDERGLFIARVDGHMAYTANGYAFNRWYFRAAMILFVVLVVLVAWANGVGMREAYFSCPASSREPCRNPFLVEMGSGQFCSVGDAALCGAPTLAPGESWGTRPPWLLRNACVFLFLLVGAAFADNHFRYNRGKVPFDSWRRQA